MVQEPTQEFKSTAVLPYMKGASEVLLCLQRPGVCTVLKSGTSVGSHLVRHKGALKTKQDGVQIGFWHGWKIRSSETLSSNCWVAKLQTAN